MNVEAFLQELSCRPENVSPPEDFSFLLTDIKIDSKKNIFNKSLEQKRYLPETVLFGSKYGGRKKDFDNAVCLFGTSKSGHSVCVFVDDFTPYFDISLSPTWEEEDIVSIVEFLENDLKKIKKGDINIKYTTYNGSRVFGYVPNEEGQPLVSKWLRLNFPSMDALRKAKRFFDKKDDRRKTFSKIFSDEYVFTSTVFEPAGHNSPVEQMFLTICDLVPSGWVQVNKFVAKKYDLTTCQWEGTTSIRHLSSNEGDTSIAPCVTLSFDIECVPEHSANMPQSYRPKDFVVQIGVSLEVFGKGIKKHGVICLGQTDTLDEISIVSCVSEIEVMNVFQRLIAHPQIDPDVVTGYNIYKFDFWYMANRICRYEFFSEESSNDTLNLWDRCVAFGKQTFSSRDSKIRALKNVWSTYNAPWQKDKEIRIPDTMQMLIDSADSGEELLDSYAHFNTNENIKFWWCSRLKYERCELRKTILESSAMGQNELFRFDMPGRCVFDLYLHCKNNMKMGSYTLNNVAKKFVGDQKIDLPYKEMFDLYKTGISKDKATVAEYCSKDCDLVLNIIEKAGIFTDNIEHSRVTYTLLTWLVTRGQQCRVYSQIGRFCERQGVALNYRFVKPPDTYTGATVIDPIKGYYEHPIATLDFASLYPSIMQAHNLCFSTMIFRDQYTLIKRLEKKGLVVVERIEASGQIHWFVQENTYKGILPRLLHALLTARRNVKKIMKQEKDNFKKQLLNSKQLALKISCNSVYGFTGSKTGKMGCWPIAACTTTIGRQMIDDTKEAVETKYDAQVVYGDTDSVMVRFKEADATEEGMKLSWKLAEEAAEYVTSVTFGPYPAVELEAEKVYWPYLIFDRKKRYIGRTFMHPDKPPKIDCKGVELVRRDNSQLLRDTYKAAVENMMPLTGPALTKLQVLNNIRTQVGNSLTKLRKNEIPLEKFIVTKSLKKTYKNPNLPHVVLSKKICKRILDGEMMVQPPRPGDRIPYVIIQTNNTKDKLCDKTEDLSWVKEKKKKIDREYYVTNQMMKPFNQLVKPFGALDDLWEDALHDLKRQRLRVKSLTSYFQPAAQVPSRVNTFVVQATTGQPPKKKTKKEKKKKGKQRSLFSFQ
jgi:DNA polymerase elongation subunit (family B)